MSDLRKDLIRTAAEMPKGSTERRAILDILSGDKTAAAKTVEWSDRGTSYRGVIEGSSSVFPGEKQVRVTHKDGKELRLPLQVSTFVKDSLLKEV